MKPLTGGEDELADEQAGAFKLMENKEADVQWKCWLRIAKTGT